MQIAPEVTELEALAAKAKVRMSKVLAEAGVASTTYWRWRHAGIEPNTKTVRRIKDAIDALKSPRAA